MKKILLFLAVMLLYITQSYSQATFNTGGIKVDVSEYGRIRIATTDGTKQLERASILVGTSPTDVFDYTNDANTLDDFVLVTNPLKSDFEIYGSVDNTYSDLPPNVIVKHNVYGWNNGEYTIVRFNIKNNETDPLTTTLAGLDIIPSLNDDYGFDSVSYLSTEGVIRFHKGNEVNMGMKLLSSTLTSLYSFEWYDSYSVDTDYWTWMNHGSLQALYASTTADGPVTITSQGSVTLAPGESFNVYYALALGADQTAMLANITAAVTKYEALIVGVAKVAPSANELSLGQNSPNPFKHSTTISYQLPDDGLVSLKVYNTVGTEVADLVNSNQTKGTHSIQYNGNDLPDGMYYYTLRFNGQVKSNKMFLNK
ncbi:MAG: T9SS type A sorting domain-containing protein [Bacteroidetes bacterium]|nr:T9SS type A sorting domain-containing protein [Bacteroidota bacterium]